MHIRALLRETRPWWAAGAIAGTLVAVALTAVSANGGPDQGLATAAVVRTAYELSLPLSLAVEPVGEALPEWLIWFALPVVLPMLNWVLVGLIARAIGRRYARGGVPPDPRSERTIMDAAREGACVGAILVAGFAFRYLRTALECGCWVLDPLGDTVLYTAQVMLAFGSPVALLLRPLDRMLEGWLLGPSWGPLVAGTAVIANWALLYAGGFRLWRWWWTPRGSWKPVRERAA